MGEKEVLESGRKFLKNSVKESWLNGSAYLGRKGKQDSTKSFCKCGYYVLDIIRVMNFFSTGLADSWGTTSIMDLDIDQIL